MDQTVLPLTSLDFDLNEDQHARQVSEYAGGVYPVYLPSFLHSFLPSFHFSGQKGRLPFETEAKLPARSIPSLLYFLG